MTCWMKMLWHSCSTSQMRVHAVSHFCKSHHASNYNATRTHQVTAVLVNREQLMTNLRKQEGCTREEKVEWEKITWLVRYIFDPNSGEKKHAMELDLVGHISLTRIDEDVVEQKENAFLPIFTTLLNKGTILYVIAFRNNKILDWLGYQWRYNKSFKR